MAREGKHITFVEGTLWPIADSSTETMEAIRQWNACQSRLYTQCNYPSKMKMKLFPNKQTKKSWRTVTIRATLRTIKGVFKLKYNNSSWKHSIVGSYPESGKLSFTSLKAEYLYKLFRILVQGGFLSSPLFIYCIIYLWALVIYFKIWVIQHSFTFIFLCSSWSSFGHWELFIWFLHLFDIPYFLKKHLFTLWHYKMI